MPSRRIALAAASAMLADALVVPSSASAQRPPRIFRIGFVSPTSPGSRDQAFIKGMRDLGYVPGRNVVIETRFAGGQPERLQALVDELVRLDVDVLVVGATIGAAAAKRATTTIPVVFAGSSDPVAGGIVGNLAHPEGNLTGLSLAYGDGFAGKWLELLREAAPDVWHVAVLWSSSNPAARGFVGELEAAARHARVTLDAHLARDADELDRALAAIGGGGARGLIVTPSPFAVTQQAKLIRFAAGSRRPAMYFVDDFVDAGGLMSYGPSISDTYRRSAAYVDRILRGARPADLPVEQASTFELAIHLGTAHALGLKLPQALRVRADRIVE